MCQTQSTSLPRIAICFFGITRSLTHTIRSIEPNILTPARKLGDMRMFAHFFRQATIKNLRSGERGTIKLDEHELLSPDRLELEEPEDCLAQHGFEELKAFGYEWGDDFRSLRNFIHQLHSLDHIGDFIRDYCAKDISLYRVLRDDSRSVSP